MFAVAPCAVLAQRGGQRSTTNTNTSDLPLPQPKKKTKPSTPPPRAVAVLEWVPSAAPEVAAEPAVFGKTVSSATSAVPSKDNPPKEARLIPVSIYYEGEYQDAGVFLSQPAPLALQADTVYELEHAGDPAGTFTVHSASRTQDDWIASGDYKPQPPPRPFKPNVKIALGPTVDEEDSDRPVLKRRHPEPGETTPSASTTASAKPATSSSSKDAPIGSDDPDRPTMKRRDTTSTASAGEAPAGTDDPNRPVLHRAANSSSSASGSVADLRTNDDILNPADDASRPKIKRGTYQEQHPALPSLLGNATGVRQTIAVSDAAHTEDHAFAHQWNDDAERQRAQNAMQQLAIVKITQWKKRQPALATKPAPPVAKPVRAARTSKKPAAPAAAALNFTGVQFAAYDLAFNDEPTYVFAAQTDVTGPSQIFVALVARPDIYGTLQVVFSAITSEQELQLTPRYRLVDAVDANGDGRAELLMEARNLDGRRFVLFDVYRGEANKVFETGLLP